LKSQERRGESLDAADEELWRGLEWKKAFVSLDPVQGLHDVMFDGSVATGHEWCHRKAKMKISCSGITRIWVFSSCTGEGVYKICLNGKTAAEVHAPSPSVFAELVVIQETELDLEVADFARDVRGWAGFAGPIMPRSLVVMWNSSAWDCSNGIASVYQKPLPVPAPKSSFFCIGHGARFFVEGVPLAGKQHWVNIGLQSRLPALLHRQDFVMSFSTERAFRFGSSLRILCANCNARVPIYLVHNVERVSLVLFGNLDDLVVRIGEQVLNRVSMEILAGGWKRCEFGGGSGILSVSFLGELWLGHFSVQAPVTRQLIEPTRVVPCRSKIGFCKHEVIWEEITDDAFCVFDILRNGEVIASVLPSRRVSFFDDEELDDCVKVFYKIRT
jgi:hypothetical protein